MESEHTPNWAQDIPKRFLAEETFFVNWDSLYSRLNSHYEAWSYKEKKRNKVNPLRPIPGPVQKNDI